jgi:hypothetical protein
LHRKKKTTTTTTMTTMMIVTMTRTGRGAGCADQFPPMFLELP